MKGRLLKVNEHKEEPTISEEAKQRAKNYMRLKGALEPNQTMTPKEKAKGLIDKFSNECLLTTDGGKVAALIAVNEIKRILYDQDVMIQYDYWFEVKQGIEKL